MNQESNATPKKTIEEVMAEFDRTHNIPINITDNITHPEFVDGMKMKRLGYTSVGEPNQFIAFPEKLLFEVLCLSYTILPIILISIWSYLNRSWWTLIGIPIAYLGAFSGPLNLNLFICFYVFAYGIGSHMVLISINFALFTFSALYGVTHYLMWLRGSNAIQQLLLFYEIRTSSLMPSLTSE